MADATADWIAVDWGTSALRLWAMGSDGTVLATRESDQGMARLTPDAFEPALMALAAPFLAAGRVTDVVVCGMAGARQGWIEAPYAPVPCAPLSATPVRAPARDSRIAVHVLPGLCQVEPPDVMRGEETQIAGFLAHAPGFDGVVCLPGTHTKWVILRAGRVTEFRTVMTGESFALYSEHSVLRHVMDSGWDAAAFAAAVDQARDRPESVATALFAIRARAMLDPAGAALPAGARARLSGLLMGLELAATRPFWQEHEIVVLGAPALCAHYIAALETSGARAERFDREDPARAGLTVAYDHIRKGTA